MPTLAPMTCSYRAALGSSVATTVNVTITPATGTGG